MIPPTPTKGDQLVWADVQPPGSVPYEGSATGTKVDSFDIVLHSFQLSKTHHLTEAVQRHIHEQLKLYKIMDAPGDTDLVSGPTRDT